MKIIQRDFDPNRDDYKKLWDFLIEDYRVKKEHYTWTLGRLGDWSHGLWTYQKTDPNFQSKNARLWVNAFDELVGFAISEEGDGQFHLFAKSYFEHLHGEMLDFVEEHWMVRENVVKTEVSAGHENLIRLMEERGYEKHVGAETRKYDVADFEATLSLPDGFSIVNMEDNHDSDSKILLYHSGFQNKDTMEEWDRITFKYNCESPAYNPRFDFSVITETGQHVSTCLCFIDYLNGYAEIEKVCTHKDFRQKGLSSALIQHAMLQLKAIGIKHAYITGYSSEAQKTYAKVGAEAMVQNYWYEKIAGQQ